MSDLLKGVVESGVGRGANFIALPIYSDIFESFLDDEPFHGTLNLHLNKPAAKTVNAAFSEGKVFDNLEFKGKSYGGIVVIPICMHTAKGDIKAVGVRPYLTTHDSDVIEVVSNYHLRVHLDLQDGDTIEFELL